ncbi:MAG: 2Fe-2S iron-sulfur cluster binding domain-containing protein, partial [Gammaproteobacteria bacterium]
PVRGGQKLLTAALEAGLDWPHDCRVGSCGMCRCVLRKGAIKPLTDFVYTLSADELRNGTILACQATLKSDVEIEVTLGAGRAPVEQLAGRIAAMTPLTHDIVELAIALERPAFGAARAGQYVDVHLDRLDAPRSYSFARAPCHEDGNHVRFLVRHVPGGGFTDWLFGGDRRGTTLGLRGPFGDFHQRPGAGRMICVAGGSGLAPIHALVEDGAATGIERDCVVLFGARTQRDLYYLEHFATFAAAWHGTLDVVPVLSAEPDGSDWRGARGLVTEHLATVAGAGGFGATDQAYLCGPPAMVDAGIDALRALGMRDDAVFFDRFLDASTQPGGREGLASPPAAARP